MLEFDIFSAAGQVLIGLRGEVDMATATEVATAVRSAMGGDAPVLAVVIDFTEVTFLDCAGIRGLVECRRDVAGKGADFGIVGAHGVAARALELTGMTGPLGVARPTSMPATRRPWIG